MLILHITITTGVTNSFLQIKKSVKNYYNEVSNGKVQITPAPETYGTQNDGVVKVKLDYAHPSTSGKVWVRL